MNRSRTRGPAIKAESHEIKKLDKIDAKAFERELKQLSTAGADRS